jgi:ADP-ribose pyrophosphatase YjhB (NUDIX family)
MDARDELVALYDAAGAEIGVERRGTVYREGLWHAATGVLVRSGDGERVVLHRRTDDKLIFPGAYDCWAGGVVGPGERPEHAAARELQEELGVVAPLHPIERFRFDEDGVRYHVFTYEARWDGPLRPQASEVAWAGWVTVAELRARLADPARWPFTPDGRLGAERWLAVRG